MDLIQDLLKEVQALKESRDDLKQEVHALNGQLSQLNMNELADRIMAMEQYCHQVEDLDNTTPRTHQADGRPSAVFVRQLTKFSQCVPHRRLKLVLVAFFRPIRHVESVSELVGQTSHLIILIGCSATATCWYGKAFLLTQAQNGRATWPSSVGLKELKDKMAQYPVPEELQQCVTWEVMQAALISERQKIQEARPAGLQGTISTVPVHPLNLGSPIKDERAGSGGTAGEDLSHQVSPSHQSPSDGTMHTVTGRPLSRVSIGAERYPETVEALKEVGRLRDRHESLEVRTGQLEANKADQTQLQHLCDVLAAIEERQIPDHVPEQLNHLRTLVDSLLAEKEKVSEVESVLMNMSSDSAGRSTGSASDQDTDASQIEQLTLQTTHIRIAVLKLDEKVQVLMREKSDRVEERSSQDRHIQEQLNSLRVMIEDMMSSSSSPLSKSQQQEAVEFSRAAEQVQSSDQDQVQSSGQSQSSGQDQGQQQKEGHDPGQEISQLSQCSYKPEDKTTHLTNQEHRGSYKNTDLANDVEGALLQLQADCERLQSTSRRLTEEHSEKQIHIDRLYKMLEELDEKKADKELVEMKIEIKADKRALEGKVSRMQFDSMTEQLNNMLQELLSKISGQEKDWNKVIEKISSEMDCKLNRIELDPLKKQLDDRWRTIHKHLQTPSLPEQDDAAGLRKQLVARFHCISCDRPVEMMTPGQHMVTLPSAPGLPSHKSNRPYSVYELEQMRQHCRRQIDQEPSQFPTSRTPKLPYSQGLPELSRTRYRPTPGPGKRSSRTLCKHERIAEMADYSYLARSCGGSHTLTYPSRRYTRIQHITHLIHSDEESRPVPSGPPPQAEGANIMGLDGQVYKGGMNSRAVRLSETRLPTISPREGKITCNWKSKDKVSRSQSQRSSGVDAGHGSAKTQRSRSASSISVRDRPLSSMDCLSQDVPLQSSFHDTTTECNKDLNQSEDEPVTSL
ncbi:Glutamine-rich protein 2 [Anabarilius grahami]|uniref:Glutamine-rich protein 2 n=1 Tax=Anabarilius grahami TaxID=495550 RepID=A0A3N0YUW9_ANAGA|nr:Glutamine-rich protein 2 [Anabarilius grahami]